MKFGRLTKHAKQFVIITDFNREIDIRPKQTGAEALSKTRPKIWPLVVIFTAISSKPKNKSITSHVEYREEAISRGPITSQSGLQLAFQPNTMPPEKI